VAADQELGGRVALCLFLLLSSPRDIYVAHALWTALDECNRALVKTLSEISHLETTNSSLYAGVVKYISTLQPLQVSKGIHIIILCLTYPPSGWPIQI
jgi:hypothetical protein